MAEFQSILALARDQDQDISVAVQRFEDILDDLKSKPSVRTMVREVPHAAELPSFCALSRLPQSTTHRALAVWLLVVEQAELPMPLPRWGHPG